KTINIPKEPKDIEIEKLNFGSLNVWCKGVSKTLTLKSFAEEDWMNDVDWYVELPERAPYSDRGSSISVTPTATGTATIIATYYNDCGESKSDTATYQIVQILGTSFANPVSGSVEISVVNGDAQDESCMRTMSINNQPTPYMGAYRVELWHDVYGKVREMDVAENNPTITMNLDGLNSGVYVLRLIVDDQIVEASQLIVR
ncbi:MAG: hypothetical protein IKV26_08340, partial [Paludibacteraceae bacterium]|nr:hypothetical protein [Paludibacteraceae bacterium]